MGLFPKGPGFIPCAYICILLLKQYLFGDLRFPSGEVRLSSSDVSFIIVVDDPMVEWLVGAVLRLLFPFDFAFLLGLFTIRFTIFVFFFFGIDVPPVLFSYSARDSIN